MDANIAGNSAYAQHLIYKYRPTIANFQEVGGDKAQQIVNAKPCYDGLFGMADFKVNVLGGGQGNLIVNQLKRSSDEYKYVQQPLPDMGELLDGIIHWDKYKILDSYKESRSTLIGTYEVKIAGKKVNINIANIHAASGPVGDRQLKRFIPFIDSSMSRSGEINLVIGDTNRTPKVIRQMLGGTASKWVVKNIGPTSRNSGDQIDQLIYRPTVTVDDQPYSLNFDTTVLPDKGSDHYGILIEPSTKPIINYPKILTLAIKNKIIANSAPEATPQSVHEPK